MPAVNAMSAPSGVWPPGWLRGGLIPHSAAILPYCPLSSIDLYPLTRVGDTEPFFPFSNLVYVCVCVFFWRQKFRILNQTFFYDQSFFIFVIVDYFGQQIAFSLPIFKTRMFPNLQRIILLSFRALNPKFNKIKCPFWLLHFFLSCVFERWHCVPR